MDPTANGFQNLDTRHRVFKSPEHEFVLSAGPSVEWASIGSSTVAAQAFNTYTLHARRSISAKRAGGPAVHAGMEHANRENVTTDRRSGMVPCHHRNDENVALAEA
jgi:hypothetical protein